MPKNKHAQALGKMGGKIKSPRKAAASRENGKKGGCKRLIGVDPASPSGDYSTECELTRQPDGSLKATKITRKPSKQKDAL